MTEGNVMTDFESEDFANTVDKVNLDWSTIGFKYRKTDYSYVSRYENGAWDAGGLTRDHTLHLSECANILHYCQEVFEGLKAYTTKQGDIVCFRPDLNAERMATSAERIVMPPFPKERFLDAVKQVVLANATWVPPFGTGASLYVRPLMIGTGDTIGVQPSSTYEFRIMVTPVGAYYSSGVKPVALTVSKYDRAAPHGTGNIKAGLNYAMSLLPTTEAHKDGFADSMYLDSQSRTYVEESSGANFLFVDEAGKLVVPKSFTDSILPSITRRSLVHVAKEYLNMEVEERPVRFDEIDRFVECGMCGTAAVISPVGKVVDGEKEIVFGAGMAEVGPVMSKLRHTLTGIQSGEIEAPKGWIFKIC